MGYPSGTLNQKAIATSPINVAQTTTKLRSFRISGLAVGSSHPPQIPFFDGLRVAVLES